jgi:ABC-type phosphate transport system substrate-binding protein
MNGRTIICVLLLQLVFAGSGSQSRAQNQTNFQVIVNPENPLTTISKSQLSKIFLKKELKWENGKEIQPVDLKENSKVRQVFSEKIHGRPVSAIKAFWQKMIFSGRQIPPQEKESDPEVVSYVAEHPGAVGYVSPKTLLSRVKIIQVVN